MADPLLIKLSEEILKEATSGATKDSTEVVSEDEGVTTIEDIVQCLSLMVLLKGNLLTRLML